MDNSLNIIQAYTKLTKLKELPIPTMEELKTASRVLMGISLATLYDIISRNEEELKSTKDKLTLVNLKIKAVSTVAKLDGMLLSREDFQHRTKSIDDIEIPFEYQVGDKDLIEETNENN